MKDRNIKDGQPSELRAAKNATGNIEFHGKIPLPMAKY